MTRENRNLNLIYAISFMDLFAIALTVPLLSNHLLGLGASHFTVGLLNSLYSGIQVISGPVVGSWSDVRDRKTVLSITMLFCSFGYLLLGLTNSLAVITGIRIVLGVTKQTQSLCKAVITDLLPANERAGAFGKATAWSSLGFIIGPTLGGHLSELHNGFTYVCVLTSVLFVINLALTYAINSTNQRKHTPPVRDGTIFKNLLSEFNKSITDMTDINWSALWDIFILRFIVGFAITMYFSQQATYLRVQFDLSQRHVGYIISYFSATGMASAFALQYFSKHFYKNDDSCLMRLTHSFGVMTLSLLLLFAAPNVELFLLFLIPFALSCTILRIVSMELMLKQATNDHRGSLSGTSNSIMSIARFATPMTSGFITDKLGVHYNMLFGAVPPLVGTVLSLRMRFRQMPKTKNE